MRLIRQSTRHARRGIARRTWSKNAHGRDGIEPRIKKRLHSGARRVLGQSRRGACEVAQLQRNRNWRQRLQARYLALMEARSMRTCEDCGQPNDRGWSIGGNEARRYCQVRDGAAIRQAAPAAENLPA